MEQNTSSSKSFFERNYSTDLGIKQRGEAFLDTLYEIPGWTTQEIDFENLKWCAEHVPGPVVLLCDIFAAHRDEVMEEKASTLSVRFAFVPPDMAGQCEHLDKRKSGRMKQREIWWPKEAIACTCDPYCTSEALMAISLDMWNAIA
jgi:hypothetical protein